MKAVTSFLNRYTSLPVLLDTLVHKRLTLLDPASWEDRNDSYYIERYRETMKLKAVLAMCFTAKRETFHHWKIYSSGSSGVCIEFDKKRLLKNLLSVDGIRARTVKYRSIKELNANMPSLREWPFQKRRVFADEGEFRIIYESATKEEVVKEVSFDTASILKISLSPWLPQAMAKSISSVIKSIRGCGSLTVHRSQLIETAQWKAVIETI